MQYSSYSIMANVELQVLFQTHKDLAPVKCNLCSNMHVYSLQFNISYKNPGQNACGKNGGAFCEIFDNFDCHWVHQYLVHWYFAYAPSYMLFTLGLRIII